MADQPRLSRPAAAVLLMALIAAAAPAHAQTVEGRAVDRQTQQPVANAEVTLVDARGEAAASARSGPDGRFTVTASTPGEYRVTARRMGYGTMLSGALQLAQGQTLQVEARLVPRAEAAEVATAPAATAPGITGRVAEAGTGRAIPGATVTLLNERGHNLGRVVADAQGNFHLPVPQPGRMRLRADRVGYQRSTSGAMTVVPSDSVRVELAMSTEAVVLAPLTVVASSRSVARSSRMAAFEWRQEHHPWGRFIGPDRIARIRPFYVTDVLQQVPFVQVLGGGLDRMPTLRGRRGSRCVPTFYVDGHQALASDGLTIDQLVSGTDIAAVEVYDRPFEAPGEFAPSARNLDCGVIVIWTQPDARQASAR